MEHTENTNTGHPVITPITIHQPHERQLEQHVSSRPRIIPDQSVPRRIRYNQVHRARASNAAQRAIHLHADHVWEKQEYALGITKEINQKHTHITGRAEWNGCDTPLRSMSRKAEATRDSCVRHPSPSLALEGDLPRGVFCRRRISLFSSRLRQRHYRPAASWRGTAPM